LFEDWVKRCKPLVRPPNRSHFPFDCASEYECRAGKAVGFTATISTEKGGPAAIPLAAALSIKITARIFMVHLLQDAAVLSKTFLF
jgi:hypothetical protein